MITVYRVGVRTELFQSFFIEDEQFFETIWPRFHGQRIGKKWTPAKVYVHNPLLEEGHFIAYVDGRVFAVSAQTLEAHPKLELFFDETGELLPFKYKGREFFVFNCTNCIDALDEELQGSSSIQLLSNGYSFLPTRLHDHLFTIPETRELLCVDYASRARSDEFMGYVDQNKLRGLMFQKLWSEEKPKKTGKKRK